MNVHAFALVAQEPEGLSRLDLSDSEVVRDAAHELRRCVTDGQFAAWARRWGVNAIARLEAVDGLQGVSADDLEEAQDAANAAEKERDGLRAAVETAVTRLDAAMEGAPDAVVNRVGHITSQLEGAL